MKNRQPILRRADSTVHYAYFFLGTVDHKLNRNEWMFAKVGIATNVHHRLKSYQTHCPVPFHTGLRVALPNAKRAGMLETAILEDDELNGFRSQGEWFVIFAGPHQHFRFITNLLARFYVERYRDKSLWDARLEWIIWPDQNRASEIPDADSVFFCGVETGEKTILEDSTDATEGNRRVKGEDQAKALCDLVYPGFEESPGWSSDEDSDFES